jgi:hypothetical protein
LVTGLVISATSYLCAWRSLGDFWYFRFAPDKTRKVLEMLSAEIDAYQKKNGRLPARLTDLGRTLTSGMYAIEEDGTPVDAWGRPLHYDLNDDSYDLYSLGQDGVPGGRGLDADLHAGKIDRVVEHLTFWEFTRADGGTGIRMTCILAGLLALPIATMGEGRNRLRPASPGRVLLRSLVTAVFSIVTAVIISSFHLPSGH